MKKKLSTQMKETFAEQIKKVLRDSPTPLSRHNLPFNPLTLPSMLSKLKAKGEIIAVWRIGEYVGKKRKVMRYCLPKPIPNGYEPFHKEVIVKHKVAAADISNMNPKNKLLADHYRALAASYSALAVQLDSMPD